MLTEALKLARENKVKGLPQMGAVIAKRRKILATGQNERKTHPMMKRFDDTHLRLYLHAEIAAIIDALKTHSEKDLRGSEIYVARILKNGSQALAKPCSVCQKALDTYGITGVYYTEYE